MPNLLPSLRLIICALLLTVVAGCGYHLTTARSGQLAAVQSVWIPFFGNESTSPTAQTVLRRAFYEELHALRGVRPATSLATGDTAIKGRIISYSSRAVSYTTLDQAREFSLSLDVELEITRNGQTSPFWKGQIHGEKQYPANKDLALQHNAEDQALDAAARIVAQKFISALEESY